MTMCTLPRSPDNHKANSATIHAKRTEQQDAVVTGRVGMQGSLGGGCCKSTTLASELTTALNYWNITIGTYPKGSCKPVHEHWLAWPQAGPRKYHGMAPPQANCNMAARCAQL
jgi:hypothetical protein